MECEHFSNFRNRFIVTNLRERPNILNFKQIMSAHQKQNLEKLCKFIRNINKSFVLAPMSLLYILHICLYLFCICYCIFMSSLYRCIWFIRIKMID